MGPRNGENRRNDKASAPTMADVAREAGVSLSTVSYTLSGARPISETTRERVLEAMARLDFAPNEVARALAAQRSGILALLLPTDESETDPFMSAIIVGAASAARSSGHHLLLWTEQAGVSSELRALSQRGLIDGSLLLAVRMLDERVDMLDADGVPFTMIGRTQDPADHPFVDTDDEQTTNLVVAHLASLGHERIAFIGPPLEQVDRGYTIVNRLASGLQAAAAKEAVRLHLSYCERTASAGRDEISRLLASIPDVTAVVVMNDPAAGGILSGLAETGRRVPEDLSVVGLLMTDFVAGLTVPELTTVSPPPGELGRLAAETLIGLLRSDSGSTRQTLVPSVLTDRGSTAPPTR